MQIRQPIGFASAPISAGDRPAQHAWGGGGGGGGGTALQNRPEAVELQAQALEYKQPLAQQRQRPPEKPRRAVEGRPPRSANPQQLRPRLDRFDCRLAVGDVKAPAPGHAAFVGVQQGVERACIGCVMDESW